MEIFQARANPLNPSPRETNRRFSAKHCFTW